MSESSRFFQFLSVNICNWSWFQCQYVNAGVIQMGTTAAKLKLSDVTAKEPQQHPVKQQPMSVQHSPFSQTYYQYNNAAQD